MVSSSRTEIQTDGQTDTKVNTEGTLSGFQDFFLQPIIKDRPNNKASCEQCSRTYNHTYIICDNIDALTGVSTWLIERVDQWLNVDTGTSCYTSGNIGQIHK